MAFKIHKKTWFKVGRIIDLLRETGGVNQNTIARTLGMDSRTVSYYVDKYLGRYVKIEPFTLGGMTMKIIRLKEGVTLDKVMREYKVRRRVKG